MSALAAEHLPSTVQTELTTALIPTVTRIDTRLDVSPVSVVLAVSIVCILSPITVTGNSIILAAFYRYKRLRTASNCLLVSLAISDFGVGVFMPFGMQLELSSLPENGVSTLCIVPYCIAIALCSVSVLVTVAIAVDRLTSLAQPLRYKNIITHSSIEKYIALFWIYAIAVGLSPLIYALIMGITQPYSGSCKFAAAVLPPVRVFLVVAVWAPSALVLLACYLYVYLVARSHARAIYTVELSFRHQTQTLALPRYGQTLAVTVGAFLVLWLPFQTCMLLDIFCGTSLLSEWSVVWLGLPILAHSGANPWIYAFHHGEMRVAAGKIAEDLVTLFGVMPSRYGCSPARRGSNTNLELAEVNSQEARRPQVDDCFVPKPHCALYSSRRCLEMSSRHADISPERNEPDHMTCTDARQTDIIEENIDDLTKMLDPKYIINRNQIIDSNHNIDKITSLKYLLDPTFDKIRYLRRINQKRLSSKNFSKFTEPKFISYQNLKSDNSGSLNRKALQLNTLSDPMLNAESPAVDRKDFNEAICQNLALCSRRNSNRSSVSDPNIKFPIGSEVNLRQYPVNRNAPEIHRYSVQNLDHHRHALLYRRMEIEKRPNVYYHRPRAKYQESSVPSLNLRLRGKPARGRSVKPWMPPVHVNITPNKLATTTNNNHSCIIFEKKPEVDYRSGPSIETRRKLETMRHSESTNIFVPISESCRKFLEPRSTDSLMVPIVHSEPPSPVEPLPLASLQEEEIKVPEERMQRRKSSVRHSDPVIPSVLLNIEDCSDPPEDIDGTSGTNNSPTINPIELFEALLKNSDRSRDNRLPEPIFGDHACSRFSSRRPSDSKWSESSRSQEVLSNLLTEHHQAFPSSYSVNNFKNCNSGSDLNDLSSLDPFMCPDALTSSLRESFFSAPSVPDSEIFMSFEDNDSTYNISPVPEDPAKLFRPYPTSNSSLIFDYNNVPSRSSESIYSDRCASTKTVLRPECQNGLAEKSSFSGYKSNDFSVKRGSRLAPLASPTPTDICTPTFDIVAEMKKESGIGVRV
ncbi:uncharacterized protein [Prorops nasuta]|uniref:uncharacterized protein n=1 Tax=Prorops nasuta TaxID=863751 RepID=UPI0034CFBFCB